MKKIIALLLALMLLCTSGMTAFASKKEAATYTMPYYIEVDIANQITTVYSTEDNSIIRQMICTSGKGNLTPCGTFIMPVKKYEQDREEWYYFPEFELYAKYASRIYNGILFHSILFTSKASVNPTWGSSHALGSKASHGCIRLRIADAKWIAENCLAGTQVRIYDDGERDESLRKLLKASTYIAGEVTYEEFLSGIVQLSRGANLDSVSELQEKLNELGYSCGSVDGSFGSNTEKAVMAWQEDHGYEQDGTVSPAMFKEILACATPVPTVTPEPTPMPELSEMKYDTAVVHAETWLNVRTEPSTDAKLSGQIPNNTEIHVFSDDGDWAMIDYNGEIGYVSSNFIEVTVTREPDPTPVPTPEPTATATPEPTEVPEEEPVEEEDEAAVMIGKVGDIASHLNVRADANAEAGVLAQLNSGDAVTVTGKHDEWVAVTTNDGIEGFVVAKYLILDTAQLSEIEDFTPEGTLATIDCEGGLDLYRNAEENGGIITHLKNGQTVYMREESGEWTRVYARGFVGYLPTANLKAVEEEVDE